MPLPVRIPARSRRNDSIAFAIWRRTSSKISSITAAMPPEAAPCYSLSPSRKQANRLMDTFSPTFAVSSATRSLTD